MTFKERAEQAEALLIQARDIFSELAEILKNAYENAPSPKDDEFINKIWESGEYALLKDRVEPIIECTKFLIDKGSE